MPITAFSCTPRVQEVHRLRGIIQLLHIVNVLRNI